MFPSDKTLLLVQEGKQLARTPRKFGKCLTMSLDLVRKDPSLQLMVGPPDKEYDSHHFWVVTKEGKVIDPSRQDYPFHHKGTQVALEKNPELLKAVKTESTIRSLVQEAKKLRTKSIESLPKHSEETWPDGTHVVWRESPFPFRRKPALPSKLDKTAEVRSVPLERLHGSQRHVTAHGVAKHMQGAHGDLPLVYKELDGSHTMADGHHRAVAAHLNNQTHIQARVVDVPKDYRQ